MAKPQRSKTKQGPKKVFVIWDMTIQVGKLTLQGLERTDGWEVKLPGTDIEAGQIWKDVVEPGISNADFVLALVDKPNANVGFEIGYAFGRERVLQLATVGAALPDWMELPPFQKSYFVSTSSDVSSLRALVTSAKGVPGAAVPTRGTKTLLLCPREGDGVSVREELYRLRKSWGELPEQGWVLDSLPKRLSGVGRVVWVVVGTHETRDGAQNTSLAVVAGFALACGLDLRVWRAKSHRTIVDQAHETQTFDDLDDLGPLVASLDVAPGAKVEIDVLAAYRAFLRKQHDLVVPFFRHARQRAFEDIYVQLDVSLAMDEKRTARSQPHEFDLYARSTTLRGLLETARDKGGSLRWVIAGDPGAGKSTMCRRLAWEVGGDPDGPLVVLVSLPRLLRENKHPFDIAEADLCASSPALGKTDLAAQLRERAARRSGVWLLLDAFDEVGADSVQELWSRLNPILTDLASATVVITSRKIGLEKIAGFERADVQPLSPKRRAELVEHWLADKTRAESVLTHIDRCPQLAQLSTNPLLLTLMVAVTLESPNVPTTARGLYERAIELLLKRGASPDRPKPVAHPTSAQKLLPHLALALMDSGRLSWSESELVDALYELTDKRKNKPHAERLQQYVASWGSPDKLLADLGENSGLLGQFEGAAEPWKFWHRSLCEFLAAQRLAELPTRELKSRLQKLAKADEDGESIRFWGQTYGMACALVGDSARLETLEVVRAASPALALRALPFVDTLSAPQGFEFLLATTGWDGDHLRSLASSWPPASASKLIRERLGALSKQSRTAFDLELVAQLIYVLDLVEPGVDVSPLLTAFGVGAKPQLEFAKIPAGRFVMGDAKSPYEWDRTEHEVALTQPFQLGRTTVTETQFASLDLARQPEQSEANLPAREVSWFQAWLFCRWVGGALPTEAQWEYACRAQQDGLRDRKLRTAFWSGDSEEDLARVGWCVANSNGHPHPVGEKPANPWGLHDMHGNVWEWCADWHGDYSSELQFDPTGAAGGSGRVIRGGSFGFVADSCRSAVRDWSHPSNRWINLGFRVALPAAPSSR
ncbi:MAG: SUMF1/EgtB/PvdO family nonheme iron enzyme [Planctomycetes bacterium]|nr:SUMF1/EgtB/PvdO family nonheme iron enzyme [Planctomycetota bacterium]